MKTRLKELRVQAKLFQSELSEALGCKQNTISQWENDATEPNIDWLIRLADFYGVSIDYLLYHDVINNYSISQDDEQTNLEKIADALLVLSLKFRKELTQLKKDD